MTGLIVHEWIEKQGGAERVLDNMVAQFPDSDVACLWNDAPERFPENRVLESWMAGTPLRSAKALALPLMSKTWRSWRAQHDYEWVLASSYVFAHHAVFGTRAHRPAKFVYVHTPARYIWAPELDPRGASIPARLASPVMRRVDRRVARDESSLAANSLFIRDRIRRAWDRDARVIYPPVDVTRISSEKSWANHLRAEEHDVLATLPEVFLLGASRFVEYKGLDLVIEAGELAGIPVVIAGRGPQEAFLRERARTATVPVVIVRSPSDALLYALYQRALAFVFPAVEDFGIMPVEAMAAGCPVIVSAVGGTSESVLHGVSGFQLDEFAGSDLLNAIGRVGSLDRADISRSAERFDSTRFRTELTTWLPASSSNSPVAEGNVDLDASLERQN